MKNQTEATNVKLFASRQTIKSLCMALMSVLSLTDFLLGQGVNYILTASLNRDPLDVKQELVILFVATFIRNVFCFLQRFLGPLATVFCELLFLPRSRKDVAHVSRPEVILLMPKTRSCTAGLFLNLK